MRSKNSVNVLPGSSLADRSIAPAGPDGPASVEIVTPELTTISSASMDRSRPGRVRFPLTVIASRPSPPRIVRSASRLSAWISSWSPTVGTPRKVLSSPPRSIVSDPVGLANVRLSKVGIKLKLSSVSMPPDSERRALSVSGPVVISRSTADMLSEIGSRPA